MRALLSWILKNKIKDEKKSLCFLTFFLCLNHKDLKTILYNSSEYHFLGIFDSDKSKLQFQVIQTLNVAPLSVDPLTVLILTLISKLLSENAFFFFRELRSLSFLSLLTLINYTHCNESSSSSATKNCMSPLLGRGKGIIFYLLCSKSSLIAVDEG